MNNRFNKNHWNYKKKSKKIEKLQCGADLRIQITLVLLGLKPAMTYTLTSKDGNPEHVASVIRDTGLCAELETERPGCGLLVAQKPEHIEELRSIHEEAKKRNYSETYYEQYGRLMGYPQTAIDAFIGRIPAFTEQESFHLDPSLAFSITFSKDHWKEELAVMKAWTERIQQLAPELYREIQKKGYGNWIYNHNITIVYLLKIHQ